MTIGNEHTEHFSTEAAGTPNRAGRFIKVVDLPSAEFVPGLRFQPALGQGALVNFVHFDAQTEAPLHVHEEEQIVVVLEGEMEFEIDGDVRTLQPGDVALVPPWVPHGARTTDHTCLELDVFTPPRKTLLDLANQLEADAPTEGE